MAKLWGGRFQKSTDKKVDDFNSSIRFDKRMYKQDIRGSIAHAKMLGKQGIIPTEDSQKIIEGLEIILADIEIGKVSFDIDAEDSHMNIEKLLGKTIKGKLIETADDFAEIFLENQLVAVVPGTGFEAPHHVRWSYATSLENIKEGLDRLEELLK